jgi:hypothetical protein
VTVADGVVPAPAPAYALEFGEPFPATRWSSPLLDVFLRGGLGDEWPGAGVVLRAP